MRGDTDDGDAAATPADLDALARESAAIAASSEGDMEEAPATLPPADYGEVEEEEALAQETLAAQARQRGEDPDGDGEPTPDEVDAPDDEEAEPESDEFLEIDPVLLGAAKRSGLSEDDIVDLYDKLGDEAAEKVMGTFKTAQDTITGQFGQLGAHGQQPQEEEALPPGTSEAEAGILREVRLGGTEAPEPIKIDEELYGEDVAKMAGQHNELMQLGHLLIKERRQVKGQSMVQDMDTFLLSDGVQRYYGDSYGNESTGSISPESPQGKARVELGRAAAAMQAAASERGMPLSFSDALERMFSVIHKDFQTRAARRDVAGKLERRSRSIIARPTGRRKIARKSDGDEDAVAAAAGAIAGIGLDPRTWEA